MLLWLLRHYLTVFDQSFIALPVTSRALADGMYPLHVKTIDVSCRIALIYSQNFIYQSVKTKKPQLKQHTCTSVVISISRFYRAIHVVQRSIAIVSRPSVRDVDVP